MNLKIITGFKDEQFFTIDADEAHKAYYIYLNPEKRTVFKNGNAIEGKYIMRIEPFYNFDFGWYENHKLDEYDWEEINKTDLPEKYQKLMAYASEIARSITPQNIGLLNSPLKELPQDKLPEFIDALADKFRLN